jgi:MFS family permease
MHNLPLVYVGYGLLGGMGWGFGYISPVGNLMKWFPDRRGLATGTALSAFGLGAVLAAPAYDKLLRHFFQPPTFVGTPAELGTRLITDESGRRFVEMAAEAPGAATSMAEAVVATAADVAKITGALQESAWTRLPRHPSSVRPSSQILQPASLLTHAGGRVPRRHW